MNPRCAAIAAPTSVRCRVESSRNSAASARVIPSSCSTRSTSSARTCAATLPAPLLELLDPRQNDKFTDRYLDVPFDVSQVIFIATANYIEGIPAPLRDRMEIINLPGYTEREKLHIAKNYLVGRAIEENGLKPAQCRFEDDALRTIIEEYTHEAGVRDLERRVGAVCRSVAAEVARGVADDHGVTITPDFARGILGAGDRMVREERIKSSAPGVVTGLAYTPGGGEILFIEATKYAGRGNVMLTGQIGDVMKESMQAALSLVKTRAETLGIKPVEFTEHDIHVHVPSGAIPKDGPSAGCAMFTALASLFADRKVRSDVAMTGEITLRGLVLPIGGLKEKSLAALRAGVSEVIVPKMNEKDIADVPAEAKEKLKFTPRRNGGRRAGGGVGKGLRIFARQRAPHRLFVYRSRLIRDL